MHAVHGSKTESHELCGALRFGNADCHLVMAIRYQHSSAASALRVGVVADLDVYCFT